MKITIVSAVHGREELWPWFYRGVINLMDKIEKLGHESECVIACTTDDECQYFYDRGMIVVQDLNEWLGTKWNNVIQFAWEDGADYVLFIGSDDIISPKLMDIYNPLLGEFDFIGIEQIYFLDLSRDEVKHFTGWPGKERMSIGLGRMISKKALSKVGGRPAREKIKRGLDTSILINLRKAGIKEKIVATDNLYAIDIKTKSNINSFESQRGRVYTANYDLLKDIFGIKFK